MECKTIYEIRRTPEAVVEAGRVVRRYLSNRSFSLPPNVTYTGCGSSHFLSQLLAMATTRAGGKGQAVPCSEILLERRYYPLDETELIVIASRSGETTEALEVANMMRDLGVPTMGVMAHESPLLEETDTALIVPAHEDSVVMTHSFTAFYTALLEIIKRSYSEEGIDFRGLRSAVKEALGEEKLIKETINETDFNSTIYLGSGMLYPVALEASLKMREMAILWSEAHPTFEFRHGFKVMAGDGTLVVMLTTKPTERHEKFVRELQGQGAKVMGIGYEDFGTDLFLRVPRVSEMEVPVVYLPLVQLIAYYEAVKRGLNPDRPRFLSKVVRW